jgi:hypothetical protein
MSESRRSAREKWRRIIDAQKVTGLTVAAYCRQHELSKGSFYAWKHRLGSAAPGFVEVTAAPPDTARDGNAGSKASDGGAAMVGRGCGIEICLRGGWGLLARRGFDGDLLVELIQILERLP